MSSLRILHVDDEPDIREVVEMSLGLDPDFMIKSCGSGADALAASTEWQPDLILLDVMMPMMDGPTTLVHLREQPKTNLTPVVFMTARAQAREIESFVSLGAVGVIPKPFDPMTLANSVKSFVRPSKDALAGLRCGFLRRARNDAAALVCTKLAPSLPPPLAMGSFHSSVPWEPSSAVDALDEPLPGVGLLLMLPLFKRFSKVCKSALLTCPSPLISATSSRSMSVKRLTD